MACSCQKSEFSQSVLWWLKEGLVWTVRLDHWDSILALSLHTCGLTLGKLFNFSVSKISHLQNINCKKKSSESGNVGKIEMLYIVKVAPHPADGSCMVDGGSRWSCCITSAPSGKPVSIPQLLQRPQRRRMHDLCLREFIIPNHKSLTLACFPEICIIKPFKHHFLLTLEQIIF